MSSLRRQVSGMIDTCKTVLARKEKGLPSVDETSANLALSILEQAQEEMPGDKFLATVRLPESQPLEEWAWPGVLAAMETVRSALPLPVLCADFPSVVEEDRSNLRFSVSSVLA